MNEITMEERAKVFGLYLGSKMIMPKSGRIATLRGVDFDAGVLRLNDTEDFRDYEYFPFQLTLTPLEDITDEDVNAAWDACGMDPYVIDNSREYFLELFDPVKCAGSGDRFGQSVYLQVYDFLRSRSYHLPYKNSNLYQAGIAVKPEKK